MRITVAQYLTLLSKITEGRKNILLKLYAFGPFADTIVLAKALGYRDESPANLHIGSIGRYFCEQLDILPDYNYSHRGRILPAYFTAVHGYYKNGWDLLPNLRKAMEQLGWTTQAAIAGHDILVTEEQLLDRTLFKEGKLLQVQVNRYERDPKARKACLALHKPYCAGCAVDFKKLYGDDINDIIHVHHVKPLAGYNKKRVTDVAKDLIPLCPNCHAVVHSGKKLMTIAELKKRVVSAQTRSQKNTKRKLAK
jgi:predicted HNH restriction endonuclease